MNYLWVFVPNRAPSTPQVPQSNPSIQDNAQMTSKKESKVCHKKAPKKACRITKLQDKLILTREDLLRAGYETVTKIWSEQEDELLIHLRKKEKLQWEQIAERIPNRNSRMCYHRYQRIIFPSKDQWRERDDQFLVQLVDELGEDWKEISRRMERWQPRQIRDRYDSHLRPGIKREPWTVDEDIELMQFLNEYGLDWEEAEVRFPGRSLLHIKNRYKGRLKILNDRKLKQMEGVKLEEPESS